jgi:hypothetical protein
MLVVIFSFYGQKYGNQPFFHSRLLNWLQNSLNLSINFTFWVKIENAAESLIEKLKINIIVHSDSFQ